METITLDKAYPSCCALDTASHIHNSLGDPMKLPPSIESKLADHWANDCEDDLLALFKLMTGVEYEQSARDNTYNQENDLSDFLVYTVYAPVKCSDWVWQRGVFIAIEIGSGGDPRYCAYSSAKIYYIEDDTLADTSFFEFTLGWWAEPINRDRYNEAQLDRFNDRITVGYSSSPYCELERLLYAEPVWSDFHKAYVGRFKDTPYPVTLRPIEPCYG
jgi:hypothetical protein